MSAEEGGETPYSCSFHGMKRFRAFCEAFPELKGKKWWLTEVRNRSDEDPFQCQRMFNDTLVMGHYTLMALAMPEVECLNHHQIFGMSGGIYTSEPESRGGKGLNRWGLQRQDGGRDYPDYRAVGHRPRFETGHMGVMHRLFAEAMMEHPVVLAHGTDDYDADDDAMTASARVSDQMYARRCAMRESGRDAWIEPKPIEGAVEWTAAVDGRRQELVILFVNSSDTERLARVKTPKHEFYAPTLRVMECPAWAVSACRYPCHGGDRGCGFRRGWDYGAADTDAYLAASAHDPLVILQLEHIAAAKRLLLGTYAENHFEDWKRRGVDYMGVKNDTNAMLEGFRSAQAAARGVMP